MATIGRTIAARVSIDWDFDGTETVETGRLVSARGSHRLAPPGQSITGTGGQIAQMSIELDNSDNRYSPLIASSALYSNISGGKMYRMPIVFEVSIDGGSNYDIIFTGVLKLPRHRTLAPGQPKTLALDARGNEERILNLASSTPQADFVTYHDDEYTEGELIYDVLVNQVGLGSSEVVIADGLFPIDWFWLDDASPIESAWRLASATGGRFYCRYDGRFVYENATHWLTNSRSKTSQATFTRSDFQSLTIYYDDNDLASKVTAKANLYEFGESGELWKASEPTTVPPGESRTITAELNSPAYRIDSVTYTARTAGGTDLSGSITLTRTDYAQRIELVFANAHATLAAVISGVKIEGVGVEVAEKITVDKTSASTFWDVANPNRHPGSLKTTFSNPWIQSRAQADALAQFVLDRQEEPALFYLIEGVQGDPERLLGDRITVNDSEQMDSARDAIVIGIDWSYSAQGGFRQSLMAVDVAGLYPYSSAGTDGGYLVLGTSKLGSGSNPKGVLFY